MGQKLSPVLAEIESTLWEHEFNVSSKPDYTEEGFRAGIKIFMSVMMDKVWELQQDEKIEMDDRARMVEELGNEVKNLVKAHTNIDTFELYK